MVNFEYPLLWLPQQPRTLRRKRAAFGKHSAYSAGMEVQHELKLLGAKNCIISSNLRQRARGDGFLTNQTVDDPGIVIYFQLNGQSKAMACDKWDRPEHNLRALCLSIYAIRGLKRWGGSEFLDGLFTGFKALPAPSVIEVPAETDYFLGLETQEELKKRYHELVKQLHPDMPTGDSEEFQVMSRQYEWFKERLP